MDKNINVLLIPSGEVIEVSMDKVHLFRDKVWNDDYEMYEIEDRFRTLLIKGKEDMNIFDSIYNQLQKATPNELKYSQLYYKYKDIMENQIYLTYPMYRKIMNLFQDRMKKNEKILKDIQKYSMIISKKYPTHYSTYIRTWKDTSFSIMEKNI